MAVVTPKVPCQLRQASARCSRRESSKLLQRAVIETLEPRNLLSAIVYENHFSQGADEGATARGVRAAWSTSQTDSYPGYESGGWADGGPFTSDIGCEPSNTEFLGGFTNEAVSLSLQHLPAHYQLTFSFRIFLLGDVLPDYEDGDVIGHGGPTLTITSPTGPIVLSFGQEQTLWREFPTYVAPPSAAVSPLFMRNGGYPDGTFLRVTPLAGNCLGYDAEGDDWSSAEGSLPAQDSVWQVTWTFTHFDPTLNLDFSAAFPSGRQRNNGLWGLDDVVVSSYSAAKCEACGEVSRKPDVPQPALRGSGPFGPTLVQNKFTDLADIGSGTPSGNRQYWLLGLPHTYAAEDSNAVAVYDFSGKATWFEPVPDGDTIVFLPMDDDDAGYRLEVTDTTVVMTEPEGGEYHFAGFGFEADRFVKGYLTHYVPVDRDLNAPYGGMVTSDVNWNSQRVDRLTWAYKGTDGQYVHELIGFQWELEGDHRLVGLYHQRWREYAAQGDVNERVLYTYYGADEAGGNLGDLKAAKYEDFRSGKTDEYIQRYYKSSGPEGPKGAVKDVIGPEAAKRLRRAFPSRDPGSLSDGEVSPFVGQRFTYQMAPGPNGTYYPWIDHWLADDGRGTASAMRADFTLPTIFDEKMWLNRWEYRFEDTSRDGARSISYYNFRGDLLLTEDRDVDGTVRSLQYTRYGTEGGSWDQPVFVAHGSAFCLHDGQFYDDALPDLGLSGANSPYLREDAGLVDIYGYYDESASAPGLGRQLWFNGLLHGSRDGEREAALIFNGGTATVNLDAHGFRTGDIVAIRTTQGVQVNGVVTVSGPNVFTLAATSPGLATGTVYVVKPTILSSFSYTTHSYAGTTVPLLMTSTVFRNSDQTGAATTSYEYTFYTTTGEVETNTIATRTTVLPVVGVDENGSGVASVIRTAYDDEGRQRWTQNASGAIRFTKYDLTTEAVLESIEDVDLDASANGLTPGERSTFPAGWSHAPSGLNLISRFDVDALGRAVTEVDPMGNITYTVYDDANDVMRIYRGWQSGSNRPTGPVILHRFDAVGNYDETISYVFEGAEGSGYPVDASGRPTGTEALTDTHTTILSLARTLFNADGLAAERDEYSSVSSLEYRADQLRLGTLGAGPGPSYGATLYGYSADLDANRTVSPNGTIERTVFDGLGREVGKWIGTNDAGASDSDPTGGTIGLAAGNNMKQVGRWEYDLGGIGDSNVTREESYPGGPSPSRVAAYLYDWRNRLVSAKVGVEASESSQTPRPLAVSLFDNLDEAVASYTFDAAGIALTDTDQDGIPDALESGTPRALTWMDGTDQNTSNSNTFQGQEVPDAVPHLVTYATYSYDGRGRLYRSRTYAVSTTTASGAPLLVPEVSPGAVETNTYFDGDGRVLKSTVSGGTTEKWTYDGVGRVVIHLTTDGAGGLGASDLWDGQGLPLANPVANDHVVAQSEYAYDANGNVIFTITRDRFDNAVGLGALGTPTASPFARVGYAASYFDALDRPIRTVDFGTNGGVLDGSRGGADLGGGTGVASRPDYSTLTRSSTVLITDYAYDEQGLLSLVTDPRNIISKTFYDAMGRTTWTVAAWQTGFDPRTGALPTQSDANQTTRYAYDAGGRMASLTAVMPSGTPSQTTAYTYGVGPFNGSVISSNDLLASVTYGTSYFLGNPAVGEVGQSASTSYTVTRSGANITVSDGTATLLTVPASGTYAIVLAGSGGNDTVTLDTSGGDLTLPGGIVLRSEGTTTLQVTGTTPLTIGNDLGAYGGNVSVVVGAGATLVFLASQHLDTVTIGSGATLQIGDGQRINPWAPPKHRLAVVTHGVTIATTGSSGAPAGTLDLGVNDLIVEYAAGGTSPRAALEALVRAGYNGRYWDGLGIKSGEAAYGAFQYSVGVLDNATLNTPVSAFDGVPVSAHAVLLKFTWMSDLDADGVVTPADAVAFATNYNEGAPGTRATGDLNYSGTHDPGDAVAFATTYNESLASLAFTLKMPLQERMTYNALGEVTTFTDRNLTVHTYERDVLGRQVSEAVAVAAGNPQKLDTGVLRQTVSYNAQGLPEFITQWNAATGGTKVNEIQRVYNGLGQLTAEYQSLSGAVDLASTPKTQYAYGDPASGSRLESMTYPNGRVLHYGYAAGVDSAIGRLSYLADDNGNGQAGIHLEEYAYLGLSTVVSRAHPEAGIALSYVQARGIDPSANLNADGGDRYTGLDRFGRVIDQNWVRTGTDAPGQTLESTDRFQYGYDENSNVLYKDNRVNRAMSELYHADFTNGTGQGYDPLNRLTAFQRGTLDSSLNNGVWDRLSTMANDLSRSQGWTLDALGNMTQIVSSSGTPGSTTTQTRTHNELNQITGISGATTPTYDANGNMTGDEKGNTLSYDAWNRLVMVIKPAGVGPETVLSAYGYDAPGRRVTEYVPASVPVALEGTSANDAYSVAPDAQGNLVVSRNGTTVQVVPAGVPADLYIASNGGNDTLTVSGGLVRLMADTYAATGQVAVTATGATTRVEFLGTQRLRTLTVSAGARVTFVGGPYASQLQATAVSVNTGGALEVTGVSATVTFSTLTVSGAAVTVALGDFSTFRATTSLSVTAGGQFLLTSGYVLNFQSGPLTVTGATLAIRAASGSVQASSTSLGAGATMTLWDGQSDGDPVYFWTGALTMNATALLDLTTNRLSVGSAAVSTIRSLILAGRNGGTWDGAYGITSSAAPLLNAAYGQPYTGLGYTGHQGETGGVEVALAWVGDNNLDGYVDEENDLGTASLMTGGDWADGDTDYDGDVDTADVDRTTSVLWNDVYGLFWLKRAIEVPVISTATVTPGQTQLFYSSAWQVLEERKAGSTAATKQYVWSPVYVDAMVLRDADTAAGGDLGMPQSGLDQRLYVQQDASYNVTAITNASGVVQERYLYDPYGQVTITDGSYTPKSRNTSGSAWQYLFQGKRRDVSADLDDSRIRVYGSALGRFAQPEPFGGAYIDGANLYHFVGDSPTSAVDPSGLARIKNLPHYNRDTDTRNLVGFAVRLSRNDAFFSDMVGALGDGITAPATSLYDAFSAAQHDLGRRGDFDNVYNHLGNHGNMGSPRGMGTSAQAQALGKVGPVLTAYAAASFMYPGRITPRVDVAARRAAMMARRWANTWMTREAFADLARYVPGLAKLRAAQCVSVPPKGVRSANRVLKQAGAESLGGSAEEAYAAIRASRTDVAEISRATGFKPRNIQTVKDHLFYREHLLDRYVDYGEPAVMARFDSDTAIAGAWQRLQTGTHTASDIALLKHEMAEATLMRRWADPSYTRAHSAAQARYPWEAP